MHTIFHWIYKILLSSFCVLFSKVIASHNPELRTDEYLASNPWTDHVKPFEKLFKIHKINSFLEFGVGEGTKYYLDHCNEVTSVELLDKAKMHNRSYYEECVKLFSVYSNWHPKLHVCGEAIDSAVNTAEKLRIDPSSVNTTYMNEIHSICDDLFKDKKYDAVLVDSGVIVRGSIVNALFDRVDIIAAHDTSALPDVYGWAWVKTPPNYEHIVFLEGSGTSFWIKKNKTKLIKQLKNLNKKSLKTN